MSQSIRANVLHSIAAGRKPESELRAQLHPAPSLQHEWSSQFPAPIPDSSPPLLYPPEQRRQLTLHLHPPQPAPAQRRPHTPAAHSAPAASPPHASAIASAAPVAGSLPPQEQHRQRSKSRLSLGVRLQQNQQHHTHHRKHAERRLLPVPRMRLPHQEPLRAHRQKSHQPH